MTLLLNVLAQIEKGDLQSIICEVPKELLGGLKLKADGTADLGTLLKICQRIKRTEALIEKGLKSADRAHLYNLIYNASIAKKYHPK